MDNHDDSIAMDEQAANHDLEVDKDQFLKII